MTTMELNAMLLKELSTIASDENMVKEVICYIRRLRQSYAKTEVQPYTTEELNARIDQAEKNYTEGRYTESSKVRKEITDLLASL
ncbi:MAG: hypothetical protein LUH63_20795 [Parabacteroides sp.]|nr:hypothetical protein [Parabacteroides sp.]